MVLCETVDDGRDDAIVIQPFQKTQKTIMLILFIDFISLVVILER